MHSFALPSCPTAGAPALGIAGAPVAGAACGAVTGGIGGTAPAIAGSLVGSGVGAVFDAASQWVANGALWLLEQVGSLMSKSTAVGIGTEWFGAHEAVMASLAAAVVLPMALAGTIQAIYHQSAGRLARAFLVDLPLALLFTGVAVELVSLGLAITDALSDRVMASAGVDTQHLLAPIAGFLGGTSATGAPAFVVFLGAVIVAVCAFSLWLELVVRAAAIAAASIFLPLALATLVWPSVSHWCRRLAETITALVLSKLVIVTVLSLATGALAGGLGTTGANGGGFAAVVLGVALLVLACLSPFALLRFVPAVEAGAVMHMEGARHRLFSAARTADSARRYVTQVVAAGTTGGTSAAALSLVGDVAQIDAGGIGDVGEEGVGPIRARSSGGTATDDGQPYTGTGIEKLEGIEGLRNAFGPAEVSEAQSESIGPGRESSGRRRPGRAPDERSSEGDLPQDGKSPGPWDR